MKWHWGELSKHECPEGVEHAWAARLAMDEAPGLLADGLDHAGVAVPGAGGGVAGGEVECLPPRVARFEDPRALAAADDEVRVVLDGAGQVHVPDLPQLVGAELAGADLRGGLGLRAGAP